MRITVVGAGVIGLLAAVEGTLAGHRVTVVDQGDIPFPGAASFDRHRIMRVLHATDGATTEAAMRAHRRWLELERLLSVECYHRVGALTVLPPHEVAGAVSLLAGAGALASAMPAAELATAYPHLRFPAGAAAVLEADTGVLLADRLLAACAGWLGRQPSAELRPRRRAVRVDGTTVQLADRQAVHGDAVIVAAGPWSRPLLPPGIAGELTVWRQSMIYCEVPRRLAAAWSATPAIPAFGRADGAWLVPPVAGTPLKLTAASACRPVPEITTGPVADTSTAQRWRDHLIDAFAELIPGLRPGWVTGSRDCHYASHRATSGPIMVSLGERAACLAACGGVSFKFAPLIARALVHQVTWSHRSPATADPLGRPALSTSTVATEGGPR